jgi:nucleoside-diphosphate-sugar epimerase
MCMSLGIGKTMCLPPPSSIPTGTSVAALLEESGAKVLLTVPSIVEEIAFLPGDRGVQILQNLDFVAFGGGMPKDSVGKKLREAGVKLINHYGATETGPLSPFFVPADSYDWHYIKLRLDTFVPMEVQLDPVSDHERTFKMSLRPFGWTERFELQDILVRKPGSHEEDMEFSIQGRTDDLICLATGEKVRPTILESLLQQHYGVKAATAFGDGRFELGVIVESTEPLEANRIEAFKASIWPLVEEAGHAMDAHARISSHSAVLVFPPGLLPRSDKGTILRLEVAKKFSKEIDQVYRELEANVTAPPLDPLSPETTIRRLIEDNIKLGLTSNSWNNEDDLFELGMDSLQAAKLRRLLIASLKATVAHSNDLLKPDEILGDFVYRHASVVKLVEAMTFKHTAVNDTSDSSWLERIVNRYSGSDSVRLQKATVAMTGATGSLGSHFLNVLLHDPSVGRIICLNRRTEDDAVARQRQSLLSRGIAVSDELFSKVEVREISPATEHLGLSATQYESLAREVTHIVHIAWPMNFKMKLPSFNGTFRTLQNLVQLACDAHSQAPRKRPRFLFVSSISTVGNYPTIKAERIVPEVAVDDQCWTLDLGYAKAKLVCEKIVQRAAEDHPEIEIGLVRFGQIAGSSTGYWNSDEHFAALVASSLTVGKFPDLRGVINRTNFVFLSAD